HQPRGAGGEDATARGSAETSWLRYVLGQEGVEGSPLAARVEREPRLRRHLHGGDHLVDPGHLGTRARRGIGARLPARRLSVTGHERAGVEARLLRLLVVPRRSVPARLPERREVPGLVLAVLPEVAGVDL